MSASRAEARTAACRWLVAAGVLGAVGMLGGCGAVTPEATATVTVTPQPPATPTPTPTLDVEALNAATLYVSVDNFLWSPYATSPENASSQGSGIVLSADGLAVTNAHVVGEAQSVVVSGNGLAEEVTADVIGVSECRDVAVLQLRDVHDLQFLDWRTEDDRIGLAIFTGGYPGGLPVGFTFTDGSISRDSFSLPTDWASVDKVIDHTALFSSGASGGPLVDEQGHLVAMNYAAIDERGYLLSIHRDVVREVLAEVETGRTHDGIGVSPRAWFDEVTGRPGVWIESVREGSSADAAGLRAGDFIESLAESAVGQEGRLADYCEILQDNGGDATLPLAVRRPSTDEELTGALNDTVPMSVDWDDTGFPGSTITVTTPDRPRVEVEVPAEWDESAPVSSPETIDAGNGSQEIPWTSMSASEDASETLKDPDSSIEIMATASNFSALRDPDIQTAMEFALNPSCAVGPDGSDLIEDQYLRTRRWDCVDPAGAPFIAFAAWMTDDVGDSAVVVKVQVPSDDEGTNLLNAIVSSLRVSF